MCGILGIFRHGGAERAEAKRLLNMLAHRGPDAEGFWQSDDGRLILGHRRLKILDLSDAANQPMVSACGRYVIVFNGEIYNYRELRAEIGGQWAWRTSSDTEVLLGLYALHGQRMLDRLNGMFAFAVYDQERDVLFVARDRFGIKPLYYIRSSGGWSFASEVPPLLRQMNQVKPDLRTVRTFLESGIYDFGAPTFFEGVSALEAGCWMQIDLKSGQATTGRWYNLLDHIPDLSGLTENDLVDETERLVKTAISDHLVADVAVGLNVSGGVDSSMLVRMAIAQLGHAHLFTQDYEGYSEEPWVREIAHGGTLHLERITQKDIDDVLSEVVRCEGEPFGGVFVCGYDFLYRAAQNENVTVLLDGNGLDESFLGYKKYHQMYLRSCQAGERKKAESDYIAFWGEQPTTLGVANQNATAIDGTTPTCSNAIAQTLINGVEAYSIPRVTQFEDAVKNAAATDLLYTKVPRGLRFNDRISMLHSCELRVPYLDHRLVEFGMGVPTRFLLNNKGTKAIFRQAAARYMPDSVAYAPKRSVQSPQREWLATAWRSKVDDLLNSESFKSRGWVNPEKARLAYTEYLNGGANSFFIWQWLNLELWAQEFLDTRRSSMSPNPADGYAGGGVL